MGEQKAVQVKLKFMGYTSVQMQIRFVSVGPRRDPINPLCNLEDLHFDFYDKNEAEEIISRVPNNMSQ